LTARQLPTERACKRHVDQRCSEETARCFRYRASNLGRTIPKSHWFLLFRAAILAGRQNADELFYRMSFLDQGAGERYPRVKGASWNGYIQLDGNWDLDAVAPRPQFYSNMLYLGSQRYRTASIYFDEALRLLSYIDR